MNEWCAKCKWEWTDSMNCTYCEAEHTTKMPSGYEPVTNADRIRAMTDEELAKWLFDRDLRTVNKLCAAANIKNTIRYDEKKCVDDIVDWLKSPVEVEE